MNLQINHTQAIDEFFDSFDLLNARKLINQLIHTAESNKTWSGTFPCDTIWLQQNLEKLMEAAYTIVANFDYNFEAMLSPGKTKETLNRQYSYCSKEGESAFQYFPRHLSQKEFLNPYRALLKFTSSENFIGWKEILKELVWHALSTSRIAHSVNDITILNIYLYLHKLVEACHLIHLRTKPQKQKHK